MTRPGIEPLYSGPLANTYQFMGQIELCSHLTGGKQMTDAESLMLDCGNWNHLIACKQMTDTKLRGSIPGRVIPKIQKMVFDTALLNN